MSEPLKPCPFCGCAATLYPDYEGHYPVGCGNHSCTISSCRFPDAEAWNRRDEPQLATARAEGRREGLEEAARWCQSDATDCGAYYAKAIRALADKGKT